MSNKILGIFSLLIGIVGAALLTVGMTTSYWSQEGSGVWNGCTVDDCLAVRVMIVISTVLGIIHALILLLHVAKQLGPNTRKIIMSAFMSALLAVIFGFVSIVVYDAKIESRQPSTFGWSFGLTCAGAAIIFINLIVILLENCNQRAAGAYSSI
ncbi:hypothetical protein CHS0354_020052 [Potamilus streckersoni]|uniref:Uncharacterized protein n=1 Tax=Potamilus streckersoni TaxID=2493646 RepID=A0AAE0SC45_9BIVA|nr:hypothetical protein CHS0354_020052 [Potamilus streckersoni]